MNLLLLLTASFLAGAVNAIAGGGTLLTFPALLSLPLPAVAANATSTLALVPGSFSAFFGYRAHTALSARAMLPVVVPSLVGGILGAFWVTRIPDATFRVLVPWLILMATGLFLAQDPLRKAFKRKDPHALSPVVPGWALGLWLLPTAVYGGFFGAGMGVMMLATLGLLGFQNLHEMNALKNLSAVCVNGVAALTFILAGKVVWAYALPMALCAAGGGVVGSRLAVRVGTAWVRRSITLTGVVLAVYFLVRH